MFISERRNEIKKILKDEKSVTVNKLSERLDVSKATVRNDLRKLEKEGDLKRTHGGAVISEGNNMVSPVPHQERIVKNLEFKKKIGKKAANLIRPGDILMIDGGTTTIQVAGAIDDAEDITIITDSVPIMQEFSKNNFEDVVIVGGNLLVEQQQMIGPLAEECIERFKANKAILGITGINFDFDNEITAQNMYISKNKQKMIKASSEVIIVADSTKIGQFSCSTVGSLKRIDKIVTDSNISNEHIKEFENRNVEVIIA